MDDLNSLRVVDLKERLKELDLPVSGKKAELVERLSQALKASVRDVKHKSQLMSEGHSASATSLVSFSGCRANSRGAALMEKDFVNKDLWTLQEENARMEEGAVAEPEEEAEEQTTIDEKDEAEKAPDEVPELMVTFTEEKAKHGAAGKVETETAGSIDTVPEKAKAAAIGRPAAEEHQGNSEAKTQQQQPAVDAAEAKDTMSTEEQASASAVSEASKPAIAASAPLEEKGQDNGEAQFKQEKQRLQHTSFYYLFSHKSRSQWSIAYQWNASGKLHTTSVWVQVWGSF